MTVEAGATLAADALTGGDGGITVNANLTTSATGSLTFATTGGGVNQTGGVITADTISSTGVVGEVKLSKTNAIDKVSAFAVTTGDFSLITANSVDIIGALSAVNITVETSKNAGTLTVSDSALGTTKTTLKASGTTGAITVTGSVTGTSQLDLNALGGVDASAGKLTTALLTGTVTGNTTLTKSTNAIDKLGAFTVTAGDFSLVDTVALDLINTLTAVVKAGTVRANNRTCDPGCGHIECNANRRRDRARHHGGYD